MPTSANSDPVSRVFTIEIVRTVHRKLFDLEDIAVSSTPLPNNSTTYI